MTTTFSEVTSTALSGSSPFWYNMRSQFYQFLRDFGCIHKRICFQSLGIKYLLDKNVCFVRVGIGNLVERKRTMWKKFTKVSKVHLSLIVLDVTM